MKVTYHREAIKPYKEIKKASPMPLFAAGVVALLFGAVFPIQHAIEYALFALFTAGAYIGARRIWKGRTLRVELTPDTGDAQTNQLLSESREILASFRAANDAIADDTVSACIDAIERAAVKILARLEEQAAINSELRMFLRYYLPTTRKILDARAAIETRGEKTENANAVRARTERMLPEIQKAFEKQLDALDKNKYLDLQVEMDVLEGMIKSDAQLR